MNTAAPLAGRYPPQAAAIRVGAPKGVNSTTFALSGTAMAVEVSAQRVRRPRGKRDGTFSFGHALIHGVAGSEP